MGFLSRLPGSNESLLDLQNPWGNRNPDFDDIAILLNKRGKRCHVCYRVVLNCYLRQKDGKNYCPDHAPKGRQR